MMNMLLEYVRNIGYFLILMSLVSNVMPDNSYKKYCRMFCGLILMVLVINPFYDFINLDGDLSDAFANASYKSQVAYLENQLINNDNSMNEQLIEQYEQLIMDECQGIAGDEGLYILDVKVDILEEEDMILTGLNITVTTDIDMYLEEQEKTNDNGNSEDKINIDKIKVGENEGFRLDNKATDSMDPMVISFVNRVGEFLKIDTSIIHVMLWEKE